MCRVLVLGCVLGMRRSDTTWFQTHARMIPHGRGLACRAIDLGMLVSSTCSSCTIERDADSDICSTEVSKHSLFSLGTDSK